jgi:hypothetical protein
VDGKDFASQWDQISLLTFQESFQVFSNNLKTFLLKRTLMLKQN